MSNNPKVFVEPVVTKAIRGTKAKLWLIYFKSRRRRAYAGEYLVSNGYKYILSHDGDTPYSYPHSIQEEQSFPERTYWQIALFEAEHYGSEYNYPTDFGVEIVDGEESFPYFVYAQINVKSFREAGLGFEQYGTESTITLNQQYRASNISVFNKVFQLLLPKGLAWYINFSNTFKLLVEAILETAVSIKTLFRNIYNQVFYDTTTSLSLWEDQFGIINKEGVSDDQRRLIIKSKWNAQGGQSPGYIESILATFGIDAKVYENFLYWDPNDILSDIVFSYTCGDVTVTCGSGATMDYPSAEARLLVNGDIVSTTRNYINTANTGLLVTASNDTHMGAYIGLKREDKEYPISSYPEYWIYYWLIASPEDPGRYVEVPIDLREAIDTALLQVKPTHTRAILLFKYV